MGAFDTNEASGDGNGINSFMTSESPTMGVLRSLTFFVGEVEPRRGIPVDLARRLSAFPVKTIDLEERYRRSEERVRVSYPIHLRWRACHLHQCRLW